MRGLLVVSLLRMGWVRRFIREREVEERKRIEREREREMEAVAARKEDMKTVHYWFEREARELGVVH